jgi:hypothetical protein
MRPPAPQHEMVHQGTDPSGAEEWLCQECGRHFVIRWPPDYERLVLDPGDEDAAHHGRRGDARIDRLELSPAPGDDPWRRWLRHHGVDWDG